MDVILNFLNILTKVFTNIGGWAIFGFGLIVFRKLYIYDKALRGSKLNEWFDDKEDTEDVVTRKRVIAEEKKFNDICSKHSAWAQLISVFPLMGVLGTVLGLMMQLSKDDIDHMFDSLDVALVTTFVGLFCAIILKVYDALGPSKKISDIEVMLDNFDKKNEN